MSPRHPATLARFGTRVREERLARGWSVRDLAKATGVSRATLYRVESASRSTTLDAALAIAEALGTDLGALLADGTGENSNDKEHDS